MAARPSGIVRSLFRAPVYLYRWRCGRLLGHRFLLLIHIGRRTGRRRETVLEVVEYRKAGPELVVVSAFGRRADWLRNIEANPDPEVVSGRERFIAAYRLLDAEEAIGVIARYERRHRLIAPILRLVLSRLLGWPYRGSENDRRRLVAELPLVAFRPRS
jgi:deazaflavin-dependent oxidoreductase (nitroreductase family)